jgi:hypothetical protein
MTSYGHDGTSPVPEEPRDAEWYRDSSERRRIDAEYEREMAETLRDLREDARMSAEVARAAAEATRQAAGDARRTGQGHARLPGGADAETPEPT